MVNRSNDIELESTSLSKLLEERLSVPEYQRSYVWDEVDIDKLFKQFEIYHQNIVQEKPAFYLGSIVLHEDEYKNLNIIDGQQRITTLAIINHIKGNSRTQIRYDNLISVRNIKKNYNYILQKYSKEDRN